MSILKTILRKEGHNEASAPKDLLTHLIESMADSVLVIDKETLIIASNQKAYEAFGRGNGPLKGRRLSEVIRDLALHGAVTDSLQATSTSEIEIEFIAGGTKKYKVTVSPLSTENLEAAVIHFRDVTHVDKLERIREEFLSNVSHELRTPLTSIIAFVETLQDGAVDDVQNRMRFLEVIHRNAERMHRLIDDILELSSIESGNIAMHKQTCRLNAMVGEVFISAENKAKASDVSLENNIPIDTTVEADPMRLEQILVNLIDNGVKFNSKGGSVRVSCEEREDPISVIVNDTGEGIAPEHLPRLFERFYRTDKARSREIGGTGLGLAICKHLARLHGGEMTVTSVAGQGSTFRLDLPKH